VVRQPQFVATSQGEALQRGPSNRWVALDPRRSWEGTPRWRELRPPLLQMIRVIRVVPTLAAMRSLRYLLVLNNWSGSQGLGASEVRERKEDEAASFSGHRPAIKVPRRRDKMLDRCGPTVLMRRAEVQRSRRRLDLKKEYPIPTVLPLRRTPSFAVCLRYGPRETHWGSTGLTVAGLTMARLVLAGNTGIFE
jgi:hypothetical protein